MSWYSAAATGNAAPYTVDKEKWNVDGYVWHEGGYSNPENMTYLRLVRAALETTDRIEKGNVPKHLEISTVKGYRVLTKKKEV